MTIRQPIDLPKRLLKATPLLGLFSFFLFCLFALAAYSPIYPEASGSQTKKSDSVTFDYSHVDQGYFMMKHKGSDKKLKVCVIYNGGEPDYFSLNGENRFEVYPLVNGSGTYKIIVYQNTSTKASSDKYTKIFTKDIKVNMPDANTAYLLPNQYVWYNAGSKSVAKGKELCEGKNSDQEKLDAIFDYVTKTIIYDFMKALSVQSSYIPIVDDTLKTQLGICSDYSALMACMLRSQGIPTKVVVGVVDYNNGTTQDHAWNMVLINGNWVLKDATLATKKGSDKYKYYPTKYR